MSDNVVPDLSGGSNHLASMVQVMQGIQAIKASKAELANKIQQNDMATVDNAMKILGSAEMPLDLKNSLFKSPTLVNAFNRSFGVSIPNGYKLNDDQNSAIEQTYLALQKMKKDPSYKPEDGNFVLATLAQHLGQSAKAVDIMATPEKLVAGETNLGEKAVTNLDRGTVTPLKQTASTPYASLPPVLRTNVDKAGEEFRTSAKPILDLFTDANNIYAMVSENKPGWADALQQHLAAVLNKGRPTDPDFTRAGFTAGMRQQFENWVEKIKSGKFSDMTQENMRSFLDMERKLLKTSAENRLDASLGSLNVQLSKGSISTNDLKRVVGGSVMGGFTLTESKPKLSGAAQSFLDNLNKRNK